MLCLRYFWDELNLIDFLFRNIFEFIETLSLPIIALVYKLDNLGFCVRFDCAVGCTNCCGVLTSVSTKSIFENMTPERIPVVLVTDVTLLSSPVNSTQ